MKNIATGMVFSLMMVMLLTSCGQDTSFNQEFSNATGENSETVEFQGKVVRVDTDEVNTAGKKHKTEFLLINDDPSKGDIYLQSTLMALEKYFDDEVIVRGFFADAENTIFTALDVREQENEETNENSNMNVEMKSYTNSDLGVQFTYPSVWKLGATSSNNVKLVTDASSESVMTLFRVAHAEFDTVEKWIEKNYEGAGFKSMQVGSVTGYSVNTDDGSEVIVVDINGYFYQFSYDYFGEDMSKSDADTYFEELQKSVKFFKPGDNKELEAMEKEDENEDSNENSSSSDENDTTEAVSEDVSAIVEYMKSHKDTLPADSDSVAITQIEVAGSNYVYVTYVDGEANKKVLYQFAKSGDDFELTEKGAFVEGDTTTWERVSGNNVAANLERQVFNISDGVAAKQATVEEGKSLYVNQRYNYQLQYPRNWYYASSSLGEEGGLSQVTFSNKPYDEESDQMVTLKVYKKGSVDVSGGSASSPVSFKDSNGNSAYGFEGDDGRIYVVSGTADQFSTDAMMSILGSVSKSE